MRNFPLLLSLLITAQVWAHGEDKPGPHGGYISMPGAFHVELLPVSASQMKIYLLDAHWTNPTVEDSRVELSAGKKNAAKCVAAKDHFVCNFAAPLDLQKGEVTVNATRENQKGNAAKYPLPLKRKAHH